MNSETSLTVASIVNPVASLDKKDLPVGTIPKEENQTERLVILVQFFLLRNMEKKDQLYFTTSEIKEYCAKEKNQEWDTYVLENLENIDFLTYKLNISGNIPAFAFQCNIGLSESAYRYIILELEDNVKLHRHALKATDGKEIGTWNKFVEKYTSCTNGNILSVPKNTFSIDVFHEDYPSWIEFQFTNINEIKINQNFKEDVEKLELILISSEENNLDATKLVQKFRNWKINHLTVDGFATFSASNLSEKILHGVTNLEFFNSLGTDFPFHLLEKFTFLNSLVAGNLVSLSNYPSDEKFLGIKTLGFKNKNSVIIPNNFFINFPNIEIFYIYEANYIECDSSIKPRMGLERKDYSVRFRDHSFESCIDLFGETDLSIYENDICTMQDTYQAVLEIKKKDH
eukprot:snap_masked-scaffold_21-processed-gene-2.30-mRNA-1 protein AED:1.00 eAED:1.00 QI:0/0/0/0/1/1/2/0/399